MTKSICVQPNQLFSVFDHNTDSFSYLNMTEQDIITCLSSAFKVDPNTVLSMISEAKTQKDKWTSFLNINCQAQGPESTAMMLEESHLLSYMPVNMLDAAIATGFKAMHTPAQTLLIETSTNKEMMMFALSGGKTLYTVAIKDYSGGYILPTISIGNIMAPELFATLKEAQAEMKASALELVAEGMDDDDECTDSVVVAVQWDGGDNIALLDVKSNGTLAQGDWRSFCG